MSWSYCGVNPDTGQEMGYSVSGYCRTCNAPIDHGLSHVCGGMHMGDGVGCGYYFCEAHLYHIDLGDRFVQLCDDCIKQIDANKQKEPPPG